MVMSLKQKEIKFKPRIELTHNIDIQAPYSSAFDIILFSAFIYHTL